MLIDKEQKKTFFNSKADFLKHKKKRITKSFMNIGESHLLGDEGTIVAVTRSFAKSNQKNLA